jgi:formylglycine-generating enzyme required for sulfatase activity/serine/threonine protein kinase
MSASDSIPGADYDAMLAAFESGVDEAELRARFPALHSAISALVRSRRAKSTLSGESTPAASPVSLSRMTDPGGYSALVDRLRSFDEVTNRYELRDEVGRGGMGVVRRAFDRVVRRTVAWKAMRERKESGSRPSPPADSRAISRFLEEAQITGQLDHPGIVPVHDLGLDADGRLFITMKLVRGEDLARIIGKIHAGAEGWNLARGLSVLQRVCEAMAFAHDRGVIHRDLKPGNVMVGEFGEVYVMDWGLAKLVGEPDSKDIRPRSDPASTRSAVEVDADVSELATMDGDVIGTPAYMPPEQAAGDLDRIGERSDVYAVGAILYHLLSGREPYSVPGRKLSPGAVLARVLASAPEPIAAIAPEAPLELVAICERAMARRVDDRYGSMRALEHDLRAFVENRVVTAYESGAIAELRKWVRRNRSLAATIAAAGLAVTVLAGWALLERGRALDHAAAARANADEARAERDKVFRVSAVKSLTDLEREWHELFPMTPARADAMSAWIDRAVALIAGRKGHESVLQEIRARGGTLEGGELDFGADVESKWWHDTLAELIARLDAFAGPRLDVPTLSSMRARVEVARGLAERTLVVPEAAWRAAIERVRSSPKYGGLALRPQLGCVPLGPDPSSGLEEFALAVTGEIPTRDESTGILSEIEGAAAVLVLLPGGEFWMGAQSEDPNGPNYEPAVGNLEGPVHRIRLDAFFLGKHELTQHQWERVMATRPSSFPAGEPYRGRMVTARHPVETVSWDQVVEFTRRIGCGVALPTEARWEYGCRAGTSTSFFSGATIEGLDRHANLADAFAKANHGSDSWTYEPSLDDGFTVTAPVGSLLANAFGLHDCHGNVGEWCLDQPLPYAIVPARDGDGLRAFESDLGRRPLRGGSFAQIPAGARSAIRMLDVIAFRSNLVGFRIAKAVE